MTLSRAHQLFQNGFYSIGISSFHLVFIKKIYNKYLSIIIFRF